MSEDVKKNPRTLGKRFHYRIVRQHKPFLEPRYVFKRLRNWLFQANLSSLLGLTNHRGFHKDRFPPNPLFHFF